jgi:hypothetical protein
VTSSQAEAIRPRAVPQATGARPPGASGSDWEFGITGIKGFKRRFCELHQKHRNISQHQLLTCFSRYNKCFANLLIRVCPLPLYFPIFMRNRKRAGSQERQEGGRGRG